MALSIDDAKRFLESTQTLSGIEMCKFLVAHGADVNAFEITKDNYL